MPLYKDEKDAVIRDFAQHEGDTGSVQVQVALLTRRIEQLTEHLKAHAKDQSSKRGLLRMVGQRRSLLKYLNATEPDAYRALIARLGLRR